MKVESPALHFVPEGQLKLAVWEWPGDSPTLLFAHATGFHGRCWDHIVQHFPGRRALARERIASSGAARGCSSAATSSRARVP